VRVLVVGAGLVGRELAARLTADGHEVVATTTTEAKVEDLKQVAAEVHVLRGAETDKLAKAAAGADAVVVCAGPDARRAMTADERAATYDDVLVQTARSVVAAAPETAHVVALSSLSVYGDAANHLDEVDEDAPLTPSQDASPRMVQAMERTYLDAGADRAGVFRCADIYGAGDPPIEDKVRFAHTVLGGSVPFQGDALFYRVNVQDVVRAIEHALDKDLDGVFNLTHAGVPVTNRERFDGISADLGFPPLTYRDELKAPAVPVSVDKLADAGFVTSHTPVEGRA
jgi:nucleoside-diphosphate-sugar epimerase